MMARKIDPSRKPYTDSEVDRMASVAHGAYLGYMGAQGVTVPRWEELDDEGKSYARDGVRTQFEAARLYTAAELHEAWMVRKRAEGWTYGPTWDATAKTHPAMVPYAELPEAQKIKDAIFSTAAGAVQYLIELERKG